MPGKVRDDQLRTERKQFECVDCGGKVEVPVYDRGTVKEGPLCMTCYIVRREKKKEERGW